MPDIKKYANFWKKYIEIERQEEKKLHLQEIFKFQRKREKLKKAILDLKGKKIKDLDEIALIRFGRKESFLTDIKEQDIVVILPKFFYKFANQDFEIFAKKIEQMPLAVVQNVGKQFIDVWVNKSFPIWILKDYVDLHLFVNDITFKRQEEALDLLPKFKKYSSIKLIVESFFKQYKDDKIKLDNLDKFYQTDVQVIKSQLKTIKYLKLNSYQQKFVEDSINFDTYLLLHGPFGTGKTTTLIGVILENFFQDKKILLAADSNTAVDNVLLRLAKFDFFKQGDIVRIGPYSRLVNSLAGEKVFSIYDLIEKHSLYKQLRHLDIQIDKLSKQQLAYKKPIPANRRGLSDSQIHYFAQIRKSYRGLKSKILLQMSKWLKIQEEINSLVEEKEKLRNTILQDIISKAKVILATNSMCFSDFLKGEKFDLIIVDEGSQATEPSTLLPILYGENFIIAGDHKQLPPTVLSPSAKALEVSLFERLIDYSLGYNNDKKAYYLLKMQYRMNEKLMQFPNKKFYNNQLVAANEVKNITLADLKIKSGNIISNTEVLYWFDVSGEQKMDTNSKSLYNLDEIKKISDILEDLLSMGVKKEDIGIISPYSAQVAKLKSKFSEYEINTIDGFQGREKEVIIISWVRTDKMGFLVDARRFNVAITRAKRLLINIGDSANLKQDSLFKDYISFVKNVGKFV